MKLRFFTPAALILNVLTSLSSFRPRSFLLTRCYRPQNRIVGHYIYWTGLAGPGSRPPYPSLVIKMSRPNVCSLPPPLSLSPSTPFSSSSFIAPQRRINISDARDRLVWLADADAKTWKEKIRAVDSTLLNSAPISTSQTQPTFLSWQSCVGRFFI